MQQADTRNDGDGETVVVRKFRLLPVPEPVLQTAAAKLLDVPGVRVATPINGKRMGLRLRYDVRKLNASRVMAKLDQLGLRPVPGILQRWRLALDDMKDGNIRDNASLRPTCCSHPPPGAGKGIHGGRYR